MHWRGCDVSISGIFVYWELTVVLSLFSQSVKQGHLAERILSQHVFSRDLIQKALRKLKP